MDFSPDYAQRLRSTPGSAAAAPSSMLFDHNGGRRGAVCHEKQPLVHADSGRRGAVCHEKQPLVHADSDHDYGVRPGDYVAHGLDQIESMLGSTQDGSSAEAGAYNSSELSGWIERMIDELSPWQMQQSSQPQLNEEPSSQTDSPSPTQSSLSSLDSLDSSHHAHADLPSVVVTPPSLLGPELLGNEDIYSDNNTIVGEGPSQAEFGDSDGMEESGVRLVHMLLACAEAVQRNDVSTAKQTVTLIQTLAKPQRGAIGKVAAHFVEALARRIFGVSGVEPAEDPLTDLLHFHFYESCPYLKFAHFTANQAILEAVQSHKRIHVIDCNLMHGLQWPALIQALALRPGGPPILRLTGIGPPHQSGNDVLQEIGQKLANLAESVNVQFEFRGVYAQKLDDVKPWMLYVRPGEAVAVNAVMQLHRLLDRTSNSCAAPAVEELLQSMRSLNPKIVTLVEHEANHNSPVFLERFMEALHYYSTMFDSLETRNVPSNQGSEQLLAELYMGRKICNIVACEGADRVERHETLTQWRGRMMAAGFQMRHLGHNAYKQASMLLTLFSGDGYRVQENDGALTLGWHERPLVAASAWHCA